MAQSGFNAEFLRAWSNEDNTCIDDVVAEMNGEVKKGERPEWDKKRAQKEAARYRQKGVNLRKFGRSAQNRIDAEAANKFLASLTGDAPAEEGDGEAESQRSLGVDEQSGNGAQGTCPAPYLWEGRKGGEIPTRAGEHVTPRVVG